MKNFDWGISWERSVPSVTSVVLNLAQFGTEKDGSEFCQDPDSNTSDITLNTL